MWRAGNPELNMLVRQTYTDVPYQEDDDLSPKAQSHPWLRKCGMHLRVQLLIAVLKLILIQTSELYTNF